MCTLMFTTPVYRTHLHMHGVHNTGQKCMHTLRKKCVCTRACAPMQRCRSFLKAARLLWTYLESCASTVQSVVCRLPSCRLDEISRLTRGWELKGQERKEKDIWTACQVNHDLTGRFCCYWCSTLSNYNRYSCVGAFFDFIEWLGDGVRDRDDCAVLRQGSFEDMESVLF